MEYRSVTEAQAICESLPGGALTKISSREHRDVLAALVQKVYVLEYFQDAHKNDSAVFHDVVSL